MKKTLLSIGVLLGALHASAQADSMEDWLQNGRPEHVETFVTDGTGTHRMPARIGAANAGILTAPTPRIPVVLVEFQDRKFHASGKTHEEVRQNYDLFFNGYDDEAVRQATGSRGSVFSYFNDMSQGKFLPDFDIIGPVTLSEGYAAYGANSGSNKDVSIERFYKEAVTKAVREGGVDWTVYDNDGDGKVDMVFFIYAGWGEHAAKSDPDAIWAKESTSSTTVTDEDGGKVTFALYGMTSEARYASYDQLEKDLQGEFPNGYNPDNMQMDGIGVCLHEMSHALGLPDFYDTGYKAFGMDLWSLMDYGEYCVSGYQPVGYTAYERSYMGWESLETLTEPQVLTLRCFADGGVGYKIVNPANENEYYVIENRQGKGWDEYLGTKVCSGLQVSHVDYDKACWTQNRVNTDAAHQRMTLIAANDSYLGINAAASAAEWCECLAGQLYPGTSFNYNLTDESTPAAAVYTAHDGVYFMSQPIRNITENEDGTVTICFRTHGQLDVPQFNEPSEVNEHGFTLSWEPVENAVRYVLELETEGGAVRSEMVDGLSFTCSDMPASAAMSCRIKAQANTPEEYVDSEWSEYLYLKTDEDIVSNVAESSQEVCVYAVNGTLVARCKSSELQRMDVHPGVYVVQYPNGSTRKIVLR